MYPNHHVNDSMLKRQESFRNERVSIPADGVDVLPTERARHAPPVDRRHDKFQFGKNPMEMTAFEQSLAEKEKFERFRARQKYIEGIQGRDGGICQTEQIYGDQL